MFVNDEKSALRRTFLHSRSLLSPQEKAAKDAVITARVLQSSVYQSAQTVFCYVSLPHEIDTRAILTDAWDCGKRVAVPRCSENGRMEFFAVSSFDDLQHGMMGISEPKHTCLRCEPLDTDLCIVPCLAMDERGYRLGYGGGYYDRYLSVHPMLTLALCYDACVIRFLPNDPFDIPIQMMVSDKEV